MLSDFRAWINYIGTSERHKKPGFNESGFSNRPLEGRAKDLYVNKDTLNGLFRKLTQHSPGTEFEEISRHDAAYLLARGLRIAKNVKTRIKPFTEKWLEKLGIPQIKLSRSLYKCYMCEENDLPENINKKILKIARKEYKKGIAGTPRESYIFYTCESCEIGDSRMNFLNID